MILLQQPGGAAFAGLAVDPDHRLIAATDIGGIERQVWHLPAAILPLPLCGETFLDRILMRTGEGGKHQLAGIRMARMHRQLIALFHHLHHLLQAAEVETRRHALGIEIQRQRDQIDVAGALSVAEQAAFDPIAPASKASSAQATPVPRSLCGCTLIATSRDG
ncbi:hypothetical protein AK51_01625 [Serratia nematodiphila DZ0503SBS1]|nr:hypothetical protein AK51_01625 [Serratia nematodiphila DZ0503SBS1]